MSYLENKFVKVDYFFLDRSLLTSCHEVINIGVTSGLYWNSVGLKSLPTIDTRSLGQE